MLDSVDGLNKVPYTEVNVCDLSQQAIQHLVRCRGIRLQGLSSCTLLSSQRFIISAQGQEFFSVTLKGLDTSLMSMYKGRGLKYIADQIEQG